MLSGHILVYTMGYTTLHYTTLHYTTLHYTTLHYTTLHYTTPHHTTPHHTTLHYTTLHYTTLHYTTLHYNIHGLHGMVTLVWLLDGTDHYAVVTLADIGPLRCSLTVIYTRHENPLHDTKLTISSNVV